MKKYVIALDQGTTSSRAVVFDKDLSVVTKAQREFTQIFPKAGYIEHDPEEIFESQSAVLEEVLKEIPVEEVASIGITNQRETTIVWNKHTGKPVYNAIVWQCRRTSALCDEIKKTDLAKYIKENTGLVVDSYFSATKIKWILDNVEGAKASAENGDFLFGTVDSWLLWKLTGEHKTDETNASRTMLYNVKNHCWDKTLLKEFGIPEKMLPEVLPSGSVFGEAVLNGKAVAVCGIAGDQQSSLFGNGCFFEGEMKNTYGTGCFLLMNVGKNFKPMKSGLLTTATAEFSGNYGYAAEGSVFTGGSVIQWLRDELKIISSAAETEKMAQSVKDTNGVYFVPAFTGLGSPYWDTYARGTLLGLTRGANRDHIARAALESIAFQTNDLVSAISEETGVFPKTLQVDGGAAANDFLMQFQADISGLEVFRPVCLETTAQGAALLSGLCSGFYPSKEEMLKKRKTEKIFYPQMTRAEAEKLISKWHKAVSRSLDWEKD